MMESKEIDLPTKNIVDDGMAFEIIGLEKKNEEAVVIYKNIDTTGINF